MPIRYRARGGRFGRSRRRPGKGRQGLWLRQPAYSPTPQSTTTGVYSDIVASPDDWEREDKSTTQPMARGGALLKDVQCQFSFVLSYNRSTTGSLVTPGVEVLCWLQNDRFANFVLSGSNFDDVLLSERVVWHRYYPYRETSVDLNRFSGADQVLQRQFAGAFRVKPNKRLREQAVGLAFRFDTDTQAPGVNDFTGQAIWTGFVSVP